MELATGITNRQLVKDIDETFAENNYHHTIDYTVAPNKYFSKNNEAPPLIKRRLTQFLHKQDDL